MRAPCDTSMSIDRDSIIEELAFLFAVSSFSTCLKPAFNYDKKFLRNVFYSLSLSFSLLPCPFWNLGFVKSNQLYNFIFYCSVRFRKHAIDGDTIYVPCQTAELQM